MPLVTSDERLHAIRVVFLLASLLCFTCKRLCSRRAEVSQLWRRICVPVASSVSLPFLISFFLSFFSLPFPVLLCHRSVWLCAGTVKLFPEVSEQSAIYPGSLPVLTLMTGNRQCWNEGRRILFVLVRL